MTDAHDVLGRLLIEAGRLPEGIRRLELALTFDPRVWTARQDLVRVAVRTGDLVRVAELRRKAAADGVGRFWLQEMRWAAHLGDREPLERLDDEVADLDAPPLIKQITRMQLDIYLRGAPVAPFKKVMERSEGRDSSYRRVAIALQFLAEVASFAGEDEVALDALERAAAHALLDVFWLDKWSTFARLRTHPRFQAVLGHVQDRANAVYDALWED
jgi:serine/threonine-protein kinase